ncbi:MAG: hypothetical protein AzoDbin1_00257 [Azoarcus sp.]|nr:hypothetical protein [Azoarcus sp.]
METRDWSGPDAEGVRTLPLTDPARSSLRGKRLRRAFDRPAPALDAWPAAWRELLARWVRRAGSEKRYRRDTLLSAAGAARANIALTLFERLVADGLAEIEERREPQSGWQLVNLRFLDPTALRGQLGLPEPDAAAQAWQQRKDIRFKRDDLEAARISLDRLAPESALNRLELLAALERWTAGGLTTGRATPRDFAYFARGNTKKITVGEWRWLAEIIDLGDYGIAAHSPLLLVAAQFRLTTPGGTLDLAAAPAFLGLPPRAIGSVTAIAAPPACWTLVENRSAFEKAAAARASNEAVVWLPGYPPGWWRVAVAHLLALAPAPARIACDPDPDGIAIALHAARLWTQAGLAWSPWQMSADDLARLSARRPLSDRDKNLLRLLSSAALPAVLAELADAMLASGEKGEQESLFWDILEA